jgi:molybdopterin molybdotransferase
VTAPSGTGARFERRDADWLSVPEALSRTLAAARPLPTETVSLVEAQGRALSEPIRAEATLPPWNNSAMDGYAVRAEDVIGSADAPVSLPVSGVVRAGGDAGKVLAPGHAIRIMTGAPIPEGADTVIRVEDTDREAGMPGVVVILSDRDAGRHVRAAGQDMREGTTLFEPGRTVTPGVVGVLVAAGRAEVEVHRRPRAAILTTGDELRTVDRYEDVRVGLGVPESNGPMLAAMARSVGAEPRPLGIAPDDAGELRERILTGRDADVLVTVGGASMGEADLVKRVLDDLGFELDFWRVRMRPGSPISFGWLVHDGRRQAVFGLPGNPSSAFVTFELFVRPFLLRLAGHRRVRRRVVPCVAGERFDTPAELTYFQRVSLQAREGVLTASLTGPQLSGLVTGLASADGLAVVAPERPSVEAGEQVDVLLLDPGPAAMPDDAFPGGPLG